MRVMQAAPFVRVPRHDCERVSFVVVIFAELDELGLVRVGYQACLQIVDGGHR